MARLIRGSLLKPGPRELALSLMRSYRALNARDLAESLRRYVLIHVDFVNEYDELLLSPTVILGQIERYGRAAGDCDDVAMLAASVLASVGIPVRLKAVNPNADGIFQHVFVEYQIGMQWIALDPTISYAPVYPSDFVIQEI